MSPAGWRALRQEPLLQFLAFGALLFAAQALVGGPAPAGGERIEVPAPRIEALRAELAAQGRRPPSEAELNAAIQRWIDEELLFREALSLGLDRSDPIVRRRLVQKMESLIDSRLEGETPDEAQLQALLDAEPARYGEPARYRFEQLFFARGSRGARLQADAEAALRRLRETPDAAVAGDPFFAGREPGRLDAVAVRKLFGAGFAQVLETLPPDRWQGPLASGYGLHLVRLKERSPPLPVGLDQARPRLLVDWRLRRRQQLLEQRLDELRRQYPVTLAAPAPQAPPAASAAAVPEAALEHFD